MADCRTIIERADLAAHTIPCAILECLYKHHSLTLYDLTKYIDDLIGGAIYWRHDEPYDLFSTPTINSFVHEKTILSAIDYANEKMKCINNQDLDYPIIVARIHKVTIDWYCKKVDRYVLVHNLGA